jgi:hypothetical protein
VAEEQREHRRGHGRELHHASDHNFRQWIDVLRGGDEHRGNGDEFDGDVDGEPRAGGAHDHHTAREPNGDCGTDGNVRGGSEWNSTPQLSVEEERREHRWCDVEQLHHAGNYDFGQWINVRSGSDEHCRDGDEFGGDVDGEPGTGGADDHHAARESDGDCGTGGDVRGGGEWNCTAQLPVAEERRGDLWRDLLQLHHASDYDIGQWINIRRGGDEHGGDGDEFDGDVDGEPGACPGDSVESDVD